jgi:hypothetical protein
VRASGFLYALACVLVPVVWGVGVVLVARRVERFVARRRGRESEPPLIEYHI